MRISFHKSSFIRADLIALALFLAISIFSLRSFFMSSDPVAFHDLAPMYRLDQLFRPFDYPWDYKSNLGSPSMLTGNAVYNVPFIGLSLILGSVAFAEKILFVLLMAISGFGFYLAFGYLLKSKAAGFVAGLVMMFNPFTLTRWEFGHNTVLLAFAALPFAVLFFFKLTKQGGRLTMFLCGIVTALMIYSSPHVAYMFILFAILYSFFDLAFSGRVGLLKRFLTKAAQLCLVIGIALVVSFPFFFQLIMVNLQVISTRAEEAVISVSPQDVTGSMLPQVALASIVAGCFMFLWWKSGFKTLFAWWKKDSTDDNSSFFIKEKRQNIVAFAILGLFSVLVVVLATDPFLPAYYWLFNNLPGFGMFREVNKFFMLSALSTAFFVGLIAEGFRRYLQKSRPHIVRAKLLPVLLVSILVLASSWQFLTGDIAGTVGTVQIPAAYQKLNSWLASQPGDFRIAFLPPVVWATTYSWAPRWFLDPYAALQAKPTVEIKSEEDLTPSASFTRWIYSALYSNRTNDWGKLLSILGVKYVILRLDADMPTDRIDLSGFSLANAPAEMISGSRGLSGFSLANTLVLWSTQNGFELVQNFSSVLVFENKYQLPTVYQTNGLSLVAGNRVVLTSLSSMNFSFSQYPVAFLDDNPSQLDKLVNNSQYIFFQGDPYWSLITSSLDQKHILKTWKYAPVSANPGNKWVSGELLWYYFNGDLNAATEGYIYTSDKNAITVPLMVDQSGTYHVLVQVYDGLQGSQGTEFTINNDQSTDFIPTNRTDGTYEWIDLGAFNLNANSKLRILNLGGPAAVSKIALVPENTSAVQHVAQILQGTRAQTVYLLDDHSWAYNTTALITNSRANDGRLVDLSKTEITTKFYTFNENQYLLNLTFQNPETPTAVQVQLDKTVKNITLTPSTDFSTTMSIGPFNLTQGYHNIRIESIQGDARFNMATLNNCVDMTTSPFNDSAEYPQVPDYSMLSGSEYKVNPTQNYLAFLEGGGSYWKLSTSNNQAPSITIFNYASLFSTNTTDTRYALKYVGLDYLQEGIIVAASGTILIAVGLATIRRRNPQGKIKT